MKNNLQEVFLEKVANKMVNNRSVYGAVLSVESDHNQISWLGASGNIKKEDYYFIASVTKLYVTAVILMLKGENKISLNDRIYKFFSNDILKGLHVLDGVDYTNKITVNHLISNTSGIPDYFYDKRPGEKSWADNLFDGRDEAWPLEKTLERVKGMKPKFIPGQKGKVFYSDTNYQLLGAVIEKVTGQKIGTVFEEYIFKPLGLKNTYTYNDVNDTKPVPMYYKSKQINIPQYMTSVTVEGGIVATAKDTMKFLKAFFNGYFFPKEELEILKVWNFMPRPASVYYGIGLERLWLPRLMSLRKPVSEVLGFWGQSGAFAFYHPESELYFTGTINQTSGFGHNVAYKAMLKIIKNFI